MKRFISIAALALVSSLGIVSCDDEFLDKTATTKYTIENAFNSWDNFQSYLYGNIYVIFRGANTSSTPVGPFVSSGDGFGMQPYSGIGLYNTLDQYGTIVEQTRPNFFQADGASAWWQNMYKYIREVNVCFDRIDRTGEFLTEKEADNIEAQCRFFRAWFHFDLLANLADAIYYAEHEIPLSEATTICSEGRLKVFHKIHEDLTKALELMDDSFAPANTINSTVIKAMLARVDLFEGSWRIYHKTQESDEYIKGNDALKECVKLCEEIAAGRSLYYGDGTDKISGQGWGQLCSTEDLSTVNEVFLFAQYKHGIKGSRLSQYVHDGSIQYCLPQEVINLYLTEDGLPIHNAKVKHYDYKGFVNGQSVYEEGEAYDYANCNPYKTFRKRDHRMWQTVIPPYYVTKAATKAYKLDESSNGMYTEYIHQFNLAGNYNESTGQYDIVDNQKISRQPGYNWHRSLPVHTRAGNVGLCVPNLNNLSASNAKPDLNGGVPLRSDQNCGKSNSGYAIWLGYAEWDYNQNSTQQDADMPIFWLAETLLNWAEASALLGQFNQTVADKTINLLRDRAGVGRMNVADIDENFDPDRAIKAWSKDIDPVMFEIRRERIVELMGTSTSLADIRRWKMGSFSEQPFTGIWVASNDPNRKRLNSATNGETALYNPATDSEYTNAELSSVEGAHILIHRDPLQHGGGWPEKLYTWYLGLSELASIPGLVQCPGWEE